MLKFSGFYGLMLIKIMLIKKLECTTTLKLILKQKDGLKHSALRYCCRIYHDKEILSAERKVSFKVAFLQKGCSLRKVAKFWLDYLVYALVKK